MCSYPDALGLSLCVGVKVDLRMRLAVIFAAFLVNLICMNLNAYSVVADSSYKEFYFFSSGPKGVIKKIVLYEKQEGECYNLAFGEWEEFNQRINTISLSNNNDRNRIIATVAHTVVDFMEFHPDAIVFAKGSTPARTRLYQMAISMHLQEICKRFEINGYYKGKWELFTRGKNYSAFTLTRRK